MKPDDAEWIVDRAGMEALRPLLDAAASFVLDTESNSMFAYRERICLMQLNVEGRLFLIDTLALGEGPDALAPIAPVLADQDTTTYIHGGEYDVACLKRDYGIALAGVWDTQQAATLIGLQRTGYGALVEAFCDVQLPKQHAQYDWGRRPIDGAAVQYALDDVRYLPTVVSALEAIVSEADLIEEVAIASEAVAAAAPHEGDFDPARVYRIKGVRDLSARQFGVMVALYTWRDAVARERDRPPGRMVANQLMVALARQCPTDVDQLKGSRARGRVVREHGQQIVQIIRDALQSPPPLPQRPMTSRPPADFKQREARLKQWRRDEADRRGVPGQAVLPARALEHLAQHGGGELELVPQLGAKRIRLYGELLSELIG